MDREIGDAHRVEAGVTAASENVAADTAAATGERKRKPTHTGKKETAPDPVEAGVTPASGSVAADTSATTGEAKEKNIAADTRSTSSEPAATATTEPRPATPKAVVSGAAATTPIPAADAPTSIDLNALHK